MSDLLAPPLRIPRHPLAVGRFGLRAVRSARGVARGAFSGERARALFAGLAAHSVLPLDRRPTRVLRPLLGALGHAVGWPVARGGSQAIADALAAYLRSLGGEIRTGTCGRVDRRPAARPGVSARGVAAAARPDRRHRACRPLSPSSSSATGTGRAPSRSTGRSTGPIPWRLPGCARAGTVHLGGTLDEIVAAEAEVARGAGTPSGRSSCSAQQSLFDSTRAPDGHVTRRGPTATSRTAPPST